MVLLGWIPFHVQAASSKPGPPKRRWPLRAAGAVAAISVILSSIIREDAAFTIMQEGIAVCAALCMYDAMYRGARRPVVLLVLPIAGWALMPLWLGPLTDAVGSPIGDAIPGFLYSDLPSFDDVFLVAMLISIVIVTAVMTALYALATRSWRVGLLMFAGGVLSAAAVTFLVRARLPDPVTWAGMHVTLQTLAVTPLLVWTLRWAAHRAGACRACGYDLSGIQGAVCPECGAASASATA